MFDALGILALGEVPIPVVIEQVHPGSKWGSRRRKRKNEYRHPKVEEVPQWKLALELANEAKFNKLVEEERLRLIRERNFSQPRKPVDVSVEIKKEIEQRINPQILEIKEEVKQRIEANNKQKDEHNQVLRDRIIEINRAEALDRAHKAMEEKRERVIEIKEQRIKNLAKARRVKKRNRL